MTCFLKLFSRLITIILLVFTCYAQHVYASGENIASGSPYEEVTSHMGDAHEAADKELEKDLAMPVIGPDDGDEIDRMIRSIRQVVSNDLNTVIFVPISGILFIPKDKEFFVRNPSYQSILQRGLSATRESKLAFLSEVVFTEYEHQAVDKRMIKFLSEMIYKGIRVILITPNTSGKFNDIDYLEQWTVEWLKERGLDLNKSYYRETKFVMNQYSTKRNGSYATFYKGLLSCNTDKGYNVAHTVIASFFVAMDERPGSVVMIHNDRNVRRIAENQLRSINDIVRFYGYDIEDTIEKLIPEDFASDVTPEDYLKFWKKLGKKLNAVKRSGTKNSQGGNPYEEDL